MVTLHIEHPISDYATWKAAFDGFADGRARSGVRAHVIRQPIDDEHYIVLDLEFDTVDQAEHFREFLRTKVWANAESSPALRGEPVARILKAVEIRG